MLYSRMRFSKEKEDKNEGLQCQKEQKLNMTKAKKKKNLKERFREVFCADKLRDTYWFQTTNQAGFSFLFFFFLVLDFFTSNMPI